MVKIINLFGDQYSGQAGKAGVFAKWKGRQYRRKYVIPANPKTTMQMAVRGYFINAVATWHIYHSLQRLVFSYLATGLVMSGFNLLVSRWQKAATQALDLPLPPEEGIKQIASAKADQTAEGITANGSEFVTSFGPINIGSLTFASGTTTPAQDAYVEREMGDVRIPTAITDTQGALGGGQVIAEGDQLVISYTSGGRTITREVLFTVPAAPLEIPAKAAIADAIRTAYYPIDFKSVVVETYDLSATTYYQLESLEIDNIIQTVYFDKSAPTGTGDTLTYISYTPIELAKLEVTKVDTSFITWRRYSDVNGHTPIAQAIEDETYDWTLSAGTYVSVIRAAQSAVLATRHELIVMEAAA